MSGLFSKEEVEGICGGFFQSSSLSIVLSFDNNSNIKKCLCCNYSKEGPDSPSANSFVDPSKLPTKFDIPARMAEIVSLSLSKPFAFGTAFSFWDSLHLCDLLCFGPSHVHGLGSSHLHNPLVSALCTCTATLIISSWSFFFVYPTQCFLSVGVILELMILYFSSGICVQVYLHFTDYTHSSWHLGNDPQHL